MRVATKTMYDLIKFNLAHIADDLNTANKIVATGKRINDLSDDPVGLAGALEIKSNIANIKQIERNINMGKSWLIASEGALTNVQNLIGDTQALCVEMASATKSAANRQAAASEVQNVRDEIISLANTAVNGRYIFAGSDTDTLPFAQDGTYNGNNNPFAIKTANDSVIQIGADGDSVFTNMLSTLNDLIAHLQGNDVPGIQDTIENLEIHYDDLSASISEVGSKMNRMEIKENILQGLTISNTEQLSRIEDADIAEAVMNLKTVEVTYQAALASSSTIMEMSLMDYLK